jgi:hypothetical protein
MLGFDNSLRKSGSRRDDGFAEDVRKVHLIA